MLGVQIPPGLPHDSVRTFRSSSGGIFGSGSVVSDSPSEDRRSACKVFGIGVGFPLESESWRSRKTTMRERWQQLVQFLQEVRTELKKVHWPTRKEVVGSTVVVIVSVVIVSFFLGGIDVILQRLLTLVIR